MAQFTCHHLKHTKEFLVRTLELKVNLYFLLPFGNFRGRLAEPLLSYSFFLLPLGNFE